MNLQANTVLKPSWFCPDWSLTGRPSWRSAEEHLTFKHLTKLKLWMNSDWVSQTLKVILHREPGGNIKHVCVRTASSFNADSLSSIISFWPSDELCSLCWRVFVPPVAFVSHISVCVSEIPKTDGRLRGERLHVNVNTHTFWTWMTFFFIFLISKLSVDFLWRRQLTKIFSQCREEL